MADKQQTAGPRRISGNIAPLIDAHVSTERGRKPTGSTRIRSGRRQVIFTFAERGYVSRLRGCSVVALH